MIHLTIVVNITCSWMAAVGSRTPFSCSHQTLRRPHKRHLNSGWESCLSNTHMSSTVSCKRINIVNPATIRTGSHILLYCPMALPAFSHKPKWKSIDWQENSSKQTQKSQSYIILRAVRFAQHKGQTSQINQAHPHSWGLLSTFQTYGMILKQTWP